MSGPGPCTRAVIYWTEERKVTIDDLKVIDDEDRYVGAVTSIKLNGKFYPAEVRLISKDDNLLSQCEDKVIAEIEALEAAEAKDKQGRKTRQRKQFDAALASTNRVSAALGERLKATDSKLAQQKKELQVSKKTNEKLCEKGQTDVDQSVLNLRRNLFKKLPAPVNGDDSDDSDSGLFNTKFSKDIQGASGEEDLSDTNDDCDVEDVLLTADTDKDNDTTNCCDHCMKLRKASTKSPLNFFSAVTSFLSRTESKEVKFLDLLPISPGIPKCEVSKGSRVYIPISDKNLIKSTSEGDPSKMARDTFLCLFGRDAIESQNVTAAGTKKGSVGIHESVRKAVLKFVNRNKGDSYKDLTSTKLNEIINKKKCQVQRAKTSPSLPFKKKCAPSKSKNSPFKTKSPSKPHASKERESPVKGPSPAKGKSPLKRPSPAKGKSPLKRPSPAKGKSPLKRPSPAKGKSPLKFLPYASSAHPGSYENAYGDFNRYGPSAPSVMPPAPAQGGMTQQHSKTTDTFWNVLPSSAPPQGFNPYYYDNAYNYHEQYNNHEQYNTFTPL